MRASTGSQIRSRRADGLGEIGVELGGLEENPLPRSQLALPEQRHDALGVGQRAGLLGGELLRSVGVNVVRLGDELEAAVDLVDQPAVMRPAREVADHAVSLLLQARRGLDVAGARDAAELLADANRVA
jgi:hypothetical protein